MPEKSLLILGAGPTGIGAGAHLHEKGHRNWTIYEKSNKIGGLAGSETDAKGFTWDRAGHVLFSKDERFNALLHKNFHDKITSLDRKSFIHMKDRWIAYPFQNNIRHLDPKETDECLKGLHEAG